MVFDEEKRGFGSSPVEVTAGATAGKTSAFLGTREKSRDTRREAGGE